MNLISVGFIMLFNVKRDEIYGLFLSLRIWFIHTKVQNLLTSLTDIIKTEYFYMKGQKFEDVYLKE